ncbi:helix-turn-helix domain-containing protein [Streptomyces sp. enrichment culture]|uniref:helix-turn-helix domain-containing protein n=1 Tax=Streptomyces sp. enrichment culture TaxID=1795815 RepID=UPI003F548E24
MKLRQTEQAARDILDALDAPEAAVSEPLQQMVRLQVFAEDLTANMVARTKQRGASWEQIGALLGMSKDTARKKFSLPMRRSAPRTAMPTAFPPARAGQAPRGCAGADSSGDGTDRSSPAPVSAAVPGVLASTAGPGDLASVLSSLQRASGLSLRALAGRSNLSPSFLSRTMSGERFPAWKNVAALARACGADPEVLRKVWEAANARRDTQPSPLSLASALRYLHLRAGSPTPWAISVTSGHDLDQDHVAELLDGTVYGPWEDIERLVRVLDGEPSFSLPLWEAETAAAPDPSPASPPQPTKPPAREETPPPATRVEELLTAFREALGPPRLGAPARRYLATPIPSATHWSPR